MNASRFAGEMLARTLPDLRMMRPVGVTREEYFAGPR